MSGKHAKPRADVTRNVVGRFKGVLSAAGPLDKDPSVRVRVTRQGDGAAQAAPKSGGKHRGK